MTARLDDAYAGLDHARRLVDDAGPAVLARAEQHAAGGRDLLAAYGVDLDHPCDRDTTVALVAALARALAWGGPPSVVQLVAELQQTLIAATRHDRSTP